MNVEIVVLNCQKCNQCFLNCSLGVLFKYLVSSNDIIVCVRKPDDCTVASPHLGMSQGWNGQWFTGAVLPSVCFKCVV